MTLDEARTLKPSASLKLSELGASRGIARRYIGRGTGAELIRVTRTGYLLILLEGNRCPSSYSPAFWDCAQ